jgi:hypothetical protein
LGYNSTKESKNTTVQLKINTNLLTFEKTFCKVFSPDEGVKYYKANLLKSKSVECFIEKKLFYSIVDIFDVSLWVNASESFDLSLTNQSFLFVKELKWNHPRIFNPELKILILNYLIPFRYFHYKLDLIGFNDSLKCNFTSGSFVSCATPLNHLQLIESIPSNIQFTLLITSFNITTKISIEYLVYYEYTSIEHLKPFMISYHERLYHPLRIVSNTMRSLNSKSFQFICNCNFI